MRTSFFWLTQSILGSNAKIKTLFDLNIPQMFVSKIMLTKFKKVFLHHCSSIHRRFWQKQRNENISELPSSDAVNGSHFIFPINFQVLGGRGARWGQAPPFSLFSSSNIPQINKKVKYQSFEKAKNSPNSSPHFYTTFENCFFLYPPTTFPEIQFRPKKIRLS